MHDHRPGDGRRSPGGAGPAPPAGSAAARSAAGACPAPWRRRPTAVTTRHRAGERDRLRDEGAVGIAHPEGERQVGERGGHAQRRRWASPARGSAARGRSSGASGSTGTGSAREPQRSLQESANTPQAMAPKTPRIGSSRSGWMARPSDEPGRASASAREERDPQVAPRPRAAARASERPRRARPPSARHARAGSRARTRPARSRTAPA